MPEGYVFNADVYCPDCIVDACDSYLKNADLCGVADTEGQLNVLAKANEINRHDEHSYDSDEFPKVIFIACEDGPHEYCAGCDADLCGG